MRIAISGSMRFAKEMISAKGKLELLRHEVVVPENADEYASGKRTIEDKDDKQVGNLIRNYFQEIRKSDAILVVNYDKEGTVGYIGGSALIEMGFAHVLGKRIYLLNSPPDLPYRDEIEAMDPIVLHGDLSAIPTPASMDLARPDDWKIVRKKILSEYFDLIAAGKKKCELRLNDFEIAEGDVLVLEEWDPLAGSYTGRKLEKTVTYVGRFRLDGLFWPTDEIDAKGIQIISLE